MTKEGKEGSKKHVEVSALREHLAAHLPPFMMPAQFVRMDKLPLTQSGKVDRAALQKQIAAMLMATPAPGAGEGNRTPLQQRIAAIWAEVLQMQQDQIGIEDTFFTIGGHSLLLAQVQARLKQEFQIDMPITDLFKYPTIRSLAERIAQDVPAPAAPLLRQASSAHEGDAVAIIGISLRMPEASTPQQFWENLRDGRESVREFSFEEMENGWSDIPELRNKLVRRSGYLDDIDLFEPEFFQMTSKEAELMDPQHRLFMECAWEAFEDAGYNVDAINAPVSVYAGIGSADYLTLAQQSIRSRTDLFQAMLASSWDFLATRVSYKLNLQGESVVLTTACSSSLMAVHIACQNLLAGNTDYALAGGTSIDLPQKKAYVYEPGFLMSEDGHCRAFDKDATGTASGNGVGVVLLKRLSDAVRDGDPIYAVIRGSATNNDGSERINFSAPSPRGQAAVIAEAQRRAGVTPDQISYVETHGTATPLGDPIEVTALTDAFRQGTDRKQFCSIGSVKTNLGHLNAASGVAGLIKVALSMQHRELPPSLHFREPNPQIDFANSPFYVQAERSEWVAAEGPRRAGVSSFGMGGTNVHLILEEAPPRAERTAMQRQPHLFPLSARTLTSLRQALRNLHAHVEQEPQVALADLAYTLQTGRRTFEYRAAVVAEDAQQLLAGLERASQALENESDRVLTANTPRAEAIYQELASTKEDSPRSAALLQELADLWVTGTPVKWQSLHRGEARNRVHAPTYAFDRRSYWLDIDVPQDTAPAVVTARSEVAATLEQTTEGALAQFWREVLGVQDVRPEDNFFEVGGNSLGLLQVKSRIYNVLNVDIELEEMFDSQTLGELSIYVELLRQFESDLASNRILPAAKQETYPLTHAQMRMWFFYKFQPDSEVYHVPFGLIRRGPLDLDLFNQALHLLAMRHTALRTVFLEVDGVPRQQIKPDSDVRVVYADLSGYSADQQRAEMLARVEASNRVPFDLTAGQLMRVLLFKLSEEEHQIYFNLHHIITDGWSFQLLVKDLSALYTSLTSGTARPPEPALQYVDFAEWQASGQGADTWEREETFWLNRLAKPLPALDLPTDYPRPEMQTFNGATAGLVMPAELSGRLNDLSKREDVSMFMLLLAAYKLFLNHMSQSDDIIVGTPIAGRTVEMEPILGLFVNTLAIRTQFVNVQTIQDLVREVKRQCLDAFQHQFYPFDHIIEKVNPERDMSRSPIFSTMFLYLKDQEQAGASAFDAVSFATEHKIAKFDLTLFMHEKAEGLFVGFEYNTDLFRPETIDRFLAGMQQVLELFTADVSAPLHSLQLVTAADRAVYAAMNDTAADFDLNQLLTDAFTAQADAHPERIALSYAGETMTYGELQQRANRVAYFLRAQGVQRNQLVAVMMERSLEMVVSLYGVVLSGAAYVPVDPDYPAGRVQYMLSDSGAEVLLTKTIFAKQLAEIADQVPHLHAVLYLDEAKDVPPIDGLTACLWSDLSAYPTTAPARVNEPDDLAYMIYTSGSTGQPKGTTLAHRAIINRLHWHQQQFQATPDDVIAQRTSVCFDVSVWELFWPLQHGARMAIVPTDVVQDPSRLHAHLVREGVTVMHFVPALFTAFVSHVAQMDAVARTIPSLRWVVTSGEALPVKPVNQWFELMPGGAKIANLYGPTEAAVDVTCYEIEGPVETVYIGKPIANTQCYVVNAAGQLCPVGVQGELLLGGVQLATGYHNQPEKTAAAFITNRLPGTPGERLYRTGDLARILADGTIEYLGRIDNQVKVRGFRIELGEIEEVLAQHDAVEMATVVVKRAADGNNMLYGFYLAPTDVQQTELRAFLARHLADFMVPARLIKLDAIPLTPNGKVDRKALEQFAKDDDYENTREYIAPSTPTEQVLAQIWAHVLKREEISITDHFFEIGGHSLLAIQILNRVSSELQVSIELKDVFLHPTLQAMAALADQLLAQGRVSTAIHIPRLPVQAHYELSHAQKRLWILHQFDPASNVYNVPFTVNVTEALQLAAFEQALHAVNMRHEALRTVFIEVDNEPRQVVLPESNCALAYEDLTALSRDEQLAHIREGIAASEAVPFDLSQGPLMRVLLWKRGEAHFQLYMNMHHIITDGWSGNVLLQDLSHAYYAYVSGAEPSWQPLAVQYADFAAWQNADLAHGTLKQHEQALLEQFAKPLPVLELPTDFPRPEVMTFDGALYETALTPDVTEQLRQLAKQEDVSLYMLLLAAYVMLLHHLTDDSDIIVGTPVAGRQTQELEVMVGFFVNTVAVRARFDDVSTLQDLLREVKRQFLSAYETQAYPFDLLIEKINPDRDTGRSPLFSAMFTLTQPEGEEQAEGLLPIQRADEQVSHQIAKFDLTLFAVEGAESIRMYFEYNTNLFRQATMERFSAILHRVLEAFVHELTQPFSALDLLTETDRARYAEVNDSSAAFPADRTIHEQFVAAAEKYPHRTAVSGEHGVITYEELNTRTNQVAHQLQALGIGAGDIVGIMMQRSADVIIAMLGILRSGAAYTAIDPSYPAERIAYMLQDSGMRLMITQEHLRANLPEHLHAITLNDLPQTSSTRDAAFTGTPDDLAYVVYTSGSTGLPKGTLMRHRGVLNIAQWQQEQFGAEGKTFLQLASCSFDASVWEIFAPLLHGGTVHVVPDSMRLSMEGLSAEIERSGATMAFLPTALFNQLGIYLSADDYAKWSSLTHLLIGGEGGQTEIFRNWQQRFGTSIQLVHMYGPTETTVYAAYHRIGTLTADDARPTVPIGRPVSNYQFYVLNEHLHLCPAGVVGELYIATPGLSAGYLNQPEKTAEAFLPHPFERGESVYKTGDIVRLLPGNVLEFVGRRDTQVKVRGYRVEIGEIEALMLEHDFVQKAAVIPVKDASGATTLSAFFTAEDNSVLSGSELKNWLSQKMPAYMLPSAFTMLDEMPLSPNGKIDRTELSQRATAQQWDLTPDYVPPTTPTEQQVAAIWSSIFQRESISAHDHFFDLGGHSLLAIQLLNRISQDLQISVEMRDLFVYATLAQLSAHIDTLREAGTSDAIVIKRLPEQAHYALSHAQKRLWFLHKFNPASRVYDVPCMTAIRSALDENLFERALELVINRHDALRTTFLEINDEPRQRIHPPSVYALVYEDISGLERSRHAAMIQRKVDRLNAAPFDLTAGQLLRTILFKRGEADYQFYWNMHHIIVDGWSFDIWFRELSEAYQALAAGVTPQLPPLAVQYVDYAAWQSEEAENGTWQQREQFWLDTLAKPLPVLELPADFPRPEVVTHNGAVLDSDIPSELTAHLRRIAKQEDVTMYMLMLSAYVMLLHHLTDDQDIIVGTPVAGRNVEALEGLIGFFVNTLAIRTRLDDVLTLQDLLHVVKTQFLSAYDHQAYPFDLLIEKINPDRDTSRSPLFSVMFSFLQQGHAEQTNPLGYAPVDEQLAHTIAKFDLTLIVSDRADDLMSVAFEYNTDLFTQETMQRFAATYQNVLCALVEQLTEPLASLELLTSTDRDRYGQLNDTAAPFAVDRTLHDWFYDVAATFPDHIALADAHKCLTYAELNARSNQLAHVLRSQGVGANDIVALMMDRSADVVVGMLGVLKAGGGYLPIDPDYPQERIHYMLADSGAKWLVADETLRDRLPEGNYAVLTMSDIPTGTSADDLTVETQASDLAYMIYTSGSTGQPKGVILHHAGVVNLIEWMHQEYHYTAEERVLHYSSFSFDVSVWEVFQALLSGAMLYILQGEQRQSTLAFAEIAAETNATAVTLPPVFFNQLAIHATEETRAQLAGMKRIFVGGEALPPEAVRAWQRQFGLTITLVNGYGPTEATIFATTYPIQELLAPAVRQMPIGRPVGNTSVYVLNRQLQLCGTGVAGELYIESVGLAHGYHNQPDKTAEAFVPHPFRPGRLLYRTGDYARLLPGGLIEYIGRRDSQVKVRGYRIEIGEIEERLLQHEAVQTAAVVAIKDASDATSLIAYYTASGDALNSHDLTDWLQNKMPAYMVPSRLSALPQMPLTPNGKIDRQALSRWATDVQVDVTRAYVAPNTPTEQQLTAIWGAIFKRERLSANDHFFELGGHSLLAIQLQNRLRNEMRVIVEMKDLFLHPTLSGLAAHIDRLQETDTVHAIEIKRLPAQPHYALSHAQNRLWFLYQLDPSSRVYDVPTSVAIKSPLDKDVFVKAFNWMIERHEALRTTFVQIDGEPRQVVHPPTEFPLEYKNFSGLEPEDLDEVISLKIDALNAQPFDLTCGPLLRAILIKRGEADYQFFLNLPHILVDGWSLDVLFGELSVAYQALIAGEEPQLPPLPVSYADYAAWQIEEQRSGSWQQREQYWLDNLAKPLPVLQLPTDFPRPEKFTYRGDLLETILPQELADELRRMAQQEDVSMYMLLLAGYFMLLHQLTDDEDIIIGTPVAGRTVEALESLIGFFVNTLAIRMHFAGVNSLQDLLQTVKTQFLNAYAHQDYPFDLLVEKVNPERDPSRSPLFSAMFNFNGGGQKMPEAGALTFAAAENELGHVISKFDLTLNAADDGHALKVVFEYKTDLFKRETVERFGVAFQNVLRAFVTQHTAPLASLDVLTAADRVCYEVLNDTQAPMPAYETIQEWFSDIVAQYPDRTAVADNDSELTYAELNARSNQLAHALRNKGVQPNEFVAVMMNRSLDVIVAMLGVLKAGAAYVFIDPDYPAERIAYMLSDSGAHMILIDEAVRDRVPEGDHDTLTLAELAADAPADDLSVTATSTDLAYLIYTSGSTGVPKGTMIRHRGVINLIASLQEAYEYSADSVVLEFATFSFDGSVWESFTALLSGAQLFILQGEQRQSINALAEAVRNTGATHLMLPTAFFRQLGLYLEEEQIAHFATLQRLFVAGEALPAEAVRVWQRRFGLATEIINAYGPTEITVACLTSRVDGPLAEDIVTVPIGSPIANTKVYVLNSRMQLCGIGVAGELYVESAGVAAGYLNQPDKTCAAFVPHPYRTGHILYKTGDYVRLLPSGQIEYIGRRDSQVKVRGYRVETMEIEEQLVQHPAVSAAVVAAKKDASGTYTLIAFYTAERELSAAEVRRYAGERMPAYMVPASFIQLEQMPTLPNGKVDRQALLTMNARKQQPAVRLADDSSRLQKRMIRVWADVLELEPSAISLDDQFFEIGGHSILLMRLQDALKKELNAHLSIDDLFRYTSVRMLAAALGDSELAAPPMIQTAIATTDDLTADIPLGPAQRWAFESGLNPEYFFLPVCLETDKPVDAETLRLALLHLHGHHDMLRAIYSRAGDQVVQTLLQPHEVHVHVEQFDLSGIVDDAAREAEYTRLAQELAGEITFAQGLMNKSVIFRLSGQTTRVLWLVSHLYSDNVTHSFLPQDLIRVYEQLAAGQQPQLGAKSVSYATWVEACHTFINSSQGAEAFAYWQPVLKKIEQVAVPVDHPQGVNTFATTRQMTLEFDEAETNRLRRTAPAVCQASLKAVLYAIVARSLSRWYEQDRVVFAVNGHGRDPLGEEAAFDLSRTAGFFVNMFPFYTECGTDETAVETTRQIERQLREMPSGGASFGWLRYLSADPEVQAAFRDYRNPEILLNYHGELRDVTKEATGEWRNGVVSQLEQPDDAALQYKIIVLGAIVGGKLSLHLTYSDAQYETESMERLKQLLTEETLRVIAESEGRGPIGEKAGETRDAD